MVQKYDKFGKPIGHFPPTSQEEREFEGYERRTHAKAHPGQNIILPQRDTIESMTMRILQLEDRIEILEAQLRNSHSRY